MDGRIMPAGIWRPKVAEARRAPKTAERRRRKMGLVLCPTWQRPKMSSVFGEHSWKRLATSSEDCGLRDG
jgi:ribosomal protein L34E